MLLTKVKFTHILAVVAVAVLLAYASNRLPSETTDRDRVFVVKGNAPGTLQVNAVIKSSVRGILYDKDFENTDAPFQSPPVAAGPGEDISIVIETWFEGESGWTTCRIEENGKKVNGDRGEVKWPLRKVAHAECEWDSVG